MMLHGSAFAQFLYEPGDRHRTGGFSSRQISCVNWGMVMARHPLGAGRAGVRAMISVEPWTRCRPRVPQPARDRRDVRGGHHSRSATSARPVHRAGSGL